MEYILVTRQQVFESLNRQDKFLPEDVDKMNRDLLAHGTGVTYSKKLAYLYGEIGFTVVNYPDGRTEVVADPYGLYYNPNHPK